MHMAQNDSFILGLKMQANHFWSEPIPTPWRVSTAWSKPIKVLPFPSLCLVKELALDIILTKEKQGHFPRFPCSLGNTLPSLQWLCLAVRPAATASSSQLVKETASTRKAESGEEQKQTPSVTVSLILSLTPC